MFSTFSKRLFPCISALLIVACGAAGGDITKEKYDKLKDGMSESAAMDILGKDACEESASNKMDGAGVMEDIETKAYSCQNPDGSNIQIMFQNDKLISKAQAGL